MRKFTNKDRNRKQQKQKSDKLVQHQNQDKYQQQIVRASQKITTNDIHIWDTENMDNAYYIGSQTKLGDAIFKFIYEHDYDQNMLRIQLYQQGITQRGIAYLIKCEWADLKCIDISNNNIGDVGVQLLASRKWDSLRYLELPSSCISGVGIKYLSQGHWVNIWKLDVSFNNIKDNGILNMRNCNFESLLFLHLFQIGITGRGVKHIADCSLPKLRQFYVSDNRIGIEGVKMLTKTNWKALTSLKLQNCEIGGNIFAYLPLLESKELKYITLKDNKIKDPPSGLALCRWLSLYLFECNIPAFGKEIVLSIFPKQIVYENIFVF